MGYSGLCRGELARACVCVCVCVCARVRVFVRERVCRANRGQAARACLWSALRLLRPAQLLYGPQQPSQPLCTCNLLTIVPAHPHTHQVPRERFRGGHGDENRLRPRGGGRDPDQPPSAEIRTSRAGSRFDPADLAFEDSTRRIRLRELKRAASNKMCARGNMCARGQL